MLLLLQTGFCHNVFSRVRLAALEYKFIYRQYEYCRRLLKPDIKEQCAKNIRTDGDLTQHFRDQMYVVDHCSVLNSHRRKQKFIVLRSTEEQRPRA